MTIEFERSYVFPIESAPYILDFIGTKVKWDAYQIIDNYLNPRLRIRQTSDRIENRDISMQEFYITRKIGDKKNGHRLEEEQLINRDAAEILTSENKLRIIKTRRQLISKSPNVEVILDIINSPMKIVILEIESTNNQMPPTASELFNVNLRECPLGAWDFFRQKIGICGAASSGKTETAKALSHLLNTRFCANSFHVLEYATSFIQKYDRHPNAMDQFMIWYSQKAREANAASKANIVISDSPTFLSYIYMMFHNKKQMDAQFQTQLVKLYKRALEDVKKYNRIIYLRPKGLTENNIRFHSVGEIHEIAKRIYAFLKGHNIPHIIAEREDAHRILESLFFMNKTGRE